MKRRVFLIIPIVIIIAAFTVTILIIKNKAAKSPYTAFEMYTNYWQKQDYAGMYEMLTSDAKSKITKENFISRYKKIYDGIEAKNIKISFTKPKNSSNNVKSLEIPFSVKMDSLAGNINLSGYKASLVKENQGKKDSYYITWSEKLIFPGMDSEDKVGVTVNAAKRGDILDRNGKTLATNGKLISIGIVPKNFNANKDASIDQMVKILDIPKDNITAKLTGNSNPDWFVPIITLSKGDPDIPKLMAIAGINYQEVDGRIYPGGEALGRLVGYISAVTADDLKNNKDGGYTAASKIGKAGLEQVYEKTLKGKNGAEIYIRKIKNGNETQQVSIAKSEAKDGENVKLSIDMDLQKKIYSEMKGDSGTASAINPKTGEVLALVSSPSYDSNLFSTYIPQTLSNQWKDKTKDPFTNRFSNSYCPGSVFKLVTAAIGLKQKTLNAAEAVNISGLTWQPDSSWGSYKITRVEDTKKAVNLRDAFVYSDNIYFAMQALKIGKENFVKGSKDFGIGEALPIDYPITKSQLTSDGSIKNDVSLADTGYGQGQVQVSSLHLALIYSALVNNGDIMTPILELKSDTKSVVWKSKAIAPENVSTLVNDLVQVVEDKSGTGHEAKIAGIRVAGKTGTPELKKDANDTSAEENGWFVAFSPDNPKILV
ncbi:MAG: penicillin-binding transpeptidase domain-containing protein, partial [Clostridiaceae bacterium]